MGTATGTRNAAPAAAAAVAAAAGGAHGEGCRIGSRGRYGRRKQRRRMSLPWRRRREGWVGGAGLGFCRDGDWGIGMIRVRVLVALSAF
jgi:hypothetical protein